MPKPAPTPTPARPRPVATRPSVRCVLFFSTTGSGKSAGVFDGAGSLTAVVCTGGTTTGTGAGVEGFASGAAATAGAFGRSRGMVMRVVFASVAVAVVSHVCLPGAVTTTLCGPGSTGTAV